MKINIKKLHKDAIIPKYAHDGDAGMDMYAVSVNITDDYIEYDTGIAMEIPEGYVGLCFPRSSNSKKDLVLANAVGVIDSIYRGSIRFRFKRQYRVNTPSTFEHYISSREMVECIKIYDIGDAIGQIIIIPYPHIEFNEVDELSSTERGESGFGSTGNN